jgi:hypothetical protein
MSMFHSRLGLLVENSKNGSDIVGAGPLSWSVKRRAETLTRAVLVTLGEEGEMLGGGGQGRRGRGQDDGGPDLPWTSLPKMSPWPRTSLPKTSYVYPMLMAEAEPVDPVPVTLLMVCGLLVAECGLLVDVDG